MHGKIKFRFGDLPKKVQDQIRANNPDPLYVFVSYDGQHLCFADRRAATGAVTVTESTMLEISAYEVPRRCPDWLKGVKCTLSIGDQFYGYLPNGLFRYGNVRAEVSTYVERVDDGFGKVIVTKATLNGEGYGASVINGAAKLYRMIRTNKVTDQSTIELWPVQVPESLVNIGVSNGVQVKKA